MYIFLKTVLLVAILNSFVLANQATNKVVEKNSYKVLCYHNVVDKITDPKIMNLTTDQLIAQFKWLKVNGYNVISLDDILKAEQGIKALPKKAVLLTFDDGYVSFYTRIYPLLKLYNYHAVYALVGKWQEIPMSQNFLYGTASRSRKMLLSWKEVNEMVHSGLIELASHTYDSHHGVPSNPQGNTQPAMTTLKYDKTTKRYESIQEYIQRVESDIKKSSDVIYRHTGIRPRSIAWPYGAYNGIVQDIAKKHGMPIALTLDDGSNTVGDLPAIKRILVGSDASFSDFYTNMQGLEYSPQRYIFVDLDDVYDEDAKKTDKNLGILIERVKNLGISTIILKAYADTDSNTLADMLYFPNPVMPTRGDLLNRVSWQLQSRAGIEDVYVQMPISAFEINNRGLTLHQVNDQKNILDIYYHMAKSSFFKGILFDDSHTEKSVSIDDKIRFTNKLKQSAKHFSIKLKTAIKTDAQTLLSQSGSFEKFLSTYNYTMLDTVCSHSKKSLTNLVNVVKQYPKALKKTVFLLNAKNSSQKELLSQMNTLVLNQALNFSYYPDDFKCNIPNQRELIKVFSLKGSPFE